MVSSEHVEEVHLVGGWSPKCPCEHTDTTENITVPYTTYAGGNNITLPKLYSLFGFKRVSLLGAGRNWSFSILDVIRITFEMNLRMQKQIRKNAPTTPVYN